GKSLSLICGALTWLREHKRAAFAREFHGADEKGEHERLNAIHVVLLRRRLTGMTMTRDDQPPAPSTRSPTPPTGSSPRRGGSSAAAPARSAACSSGGLRGRARSRRGASAKGRGRACTPGRDSIG
ncbi:hypothetical protein KEM52_004982, partial [Ascosphaera acerosa]